jgi:Flp pilus assembly protein TadD
VILGFWLATGSILGSGQPVEHPRRVDFPEAKAFIRAGDLPSARRSLEACVSLLPQDAEAWSTLGLVDFAERRFDEAAAALERSLELDARQPQAQRMLGRVQTARAQPALAERAFVEAARLDPADAEARYLLGRLYQSQDRLVEASRGFQERWWAGPLNVSGSPPGKTRACGPVT